jgi:hypothetical protein
VPEPRRTAPLTAVMRHLEASAIDDALDAAVERPRTLPAERREHEVLDEDVARLSPLRHANVNVLGRWSFRAPPVRPRGASPPRDPAESDDDDGAED